MNNNKGNHKHLTLSDRVYLEQALWERQHFNKIAAFLQKDPTTISKEVKKFVLWADGYFAKEPGNDCVHYDSCSREDICFIECNSLCKDCSQNKCINLCSDYEPHMCQHLKTAPFVCNGCLAIEHCELTKYFYRAEEAHKRYSALLSSSREGINVTPEKLKAMDELISPLIRNGQPLSHIFATHQDELGCSRQTIYNYLDMGVFDVRNIDLPRRVRYKLRKTRRAQNPVKYEYRKKRTYKDFEKYMEAFPEYEVVELDTVKGSREAGKCLLTMFFRKSSFMLIFLLPSCTQKSVADVFNYLYDSLGPRIFKKTFRVILTDNGPEFKDPWSIEKDSKGNQRTRVYYCDPYASNQKGCLEKNHEFIRYIIPKGKSMHSLTDEKVRLMTCHINSTSRDSLNGQTPFDLAELLINKKVLHLLGLRKVSPDEVILKPTLLY